MNLSKIRLGVLLIGLAVLLTGCASFKKAVVVGAMPILNDVNSAIFAQDDLELVKMGLPGNIILVEGLVRASPDNRDLLVLTCMAFSGLAIIMEDDAPEHAAALYSKGMEYGMRALRRHYGFRTALDKGQSFEEAIKKIDSESYLPALLWTGVSWAQNLNLNLNDPMVLVDGSKVKALMDQVVSIDPDFFYGLAYVIRGAYYTLMPNILVGGPKVVDGEFQKAFELTKGKLLLAKVYYARYYATLTMDEALFDDVLNEVVSSPPRIDPEINFLNAVAMEKARRLLAKKEDFF